MTRVARAMSWAEDRGRSRGLRGSSSIWLALWVLATGYRYVKKLAEPDPVIIRERIEPGEELVITHFAKGAEGPDPTVPAKKRRRRS